MCGWSDYVDGDQEGVEMREFRVVRQLEDSAVFPIDKPPADPLLRTKLRPARLPANVVTRPRLVDALSRAVQDSPLTLISALAGSGKSVLASSWAAERSAGTPVAWLSLDAADGRSDRFWSYTLQALSSAGLSLDQLTGWDGGAEAERSMLVQLAADLLEAPQPVVLVLDDFHAITGAGIEPGLDFLLRYAYPNFRLVLVTRIDPALPIHRYRLSGDIAEIRQSALAFTTDEICKYLAACGLAMTEQTVLELSSRTDGWAAGLRSAILELDAPLLCSHSHVGHDRAIREFVDAEVLHSLSAEAQQFLRRTSVSETLSPGLADELTGRNDGDEMLASLTHRNIFVEQSSRRTAIYRGSPLIRQVVLAQLTRESPAEIADLHRRCALWFAAHRQQLQAVAHAAAGQDWNNVVDMVIESMAIGSVLVSNDNDRYAAILAAVPDDLPGGAAAVVRAAAKYVRGDYELVAQELADATRLVEIGDTSPCLRLSVLLLQGLLSVRNGDGRGARLAAQSAAALLTQLGGDDVAVNTEVRALIQLARAAGLLWDGAEHDAVPELELALQLSTQSASRELTLTCRGLLALAEALRGHLIRAGELAQPVALNLDGTRSRHVAASLAMAWVHAEQYDLAQSRRCLEQIGADIGGGLRGALVLLRSRLLRWRGDATGARSLLTDNGGPAHTAPISERLRVEMSELHLMAGHADLALAILETGGGADGTSTRTELARARAKTADQEPTFLPDTLLEDGAVPLDLQVEAWLHQCHWSLVRGDEASASIAIERAARLARPQLMRRPFFESGPQIRRFLRQRVATDASAWLDPRPSPTVTTHHRPVRMNLPRAVVVERLSERELEVLRYLAEPRSTDEIGAAMFVSINTVRSHVRSILRKLAVPRRNDAVRRARELQLI
jgi:LuxR family maltose regulon positive regulatory protein